MVSIAHTKHNDIPDNYGGIETNIQNAFTLNKQTSFCNSIKSRFPFVNFGLYHMPAPKRYEAHFSLSNLKVVQKCRASFSAVPC